MRSTMALLAIATLTINAALNPAQAANSGEYALKLAFIYNFTKFVKWPTSAFGNETSPMVLCIVGDDPFPADAEQELRSRASNGHSIDLRKVKPADDMKSCHIIFIPKTEPKAATALATGPGASPSLTISELEGFAKQGGVVEMFVEDNKLRFEVNAAQAKARQLTVSSQLLALARTVRN